MGITLERIPRNLYVNVRYNIIMSTTKSNQFLK